MSIDAPLVAQAVAAASAGASGGALFWLALALSVLGVALVARCIVRGHAAADLRSLWVGLALLVLAVPLWFVAAPDAPRRGADPLAAGHADAALSPAAIAARAVIVRRCYACHSARTSMMHAPWNLDLDQPGAIDRLAPRIYHQVVMLRAMPVSNATHMSEDERAVIARWYTALPEAAAAGSAPR